jgi:hypothetical protein
LRVVYFWRVRGWDNFGELLSRGSRGVDGAHQARRASANHHNIGVKTRRIANLITHLLYASPASRLASLEIVRGVSRGFFTPGLAVQLGHAGEPPFEGSNGRSTTYKPASAISDTIQNCISFQSI